MATKRKDAQKRILKKGEYQRKNGTFEYKWRDELGDRHSIYAKTLNELRNREKEILDPDDHTTVGGIRLNDLYDRWEQIKTGLKETSLKNYRYLYTHYIRQTLGRKYISEIKKSDVKLFYKNLEKKGLSANSICSIGKVLIQVLEIGVDDEIIKNNPAQNALRDIRRMIEPPKKKALTIEEQKIFEGILKYEYPTWYPVFTVMLWTGMRAGEVGGLTWNDVDFDNNTINIQQNMVLLSKEEGGYVKIGTPKTLASRRAIPMTPKVKEILMREKIRQSGLPDSKRNKSINGVTGFVFLGSRGGSIHQNTMNRVLKNVVERYNENKKEESIPLPHISCHCLRHTFTTRMCEAGVNVKVMQDILGHSKAQTTLQIYAEVTTEFRKSEMNNFNNYFTA